MTDHHYGARSPPPTSRAAARPRTARVRTARRAHNDDEGAVITMKKIDAEIEQLQRQLEEAQKAKADEEKKEKARIAQAKKHAGESHTRAVLELYDLLEIDPEARVTRTVRDRDETVRTQRLLDMVADIVGAADPALLERLKREDRSGVEDRTPKPRRSTASAPAPADDVEVDDADDEPAPSSLTPSPTPYQSVA